MISLPRPHETSQTAALVRLGALLLALASVVVIPSAFVAAATHRMDKPTAFVTAGVLAGVTLLAIIAARSLNPLRS